MICFRDERIHVHCNIWPWLEDDGFGDGTQSKKYICCYSMPLGQATLLKAKFMSQTKSIIYQQNGPDLLLPIEVKERVFRDDRIVFQRVCSAVWGFSSSQRVRTNRDKWVDWDLCNFITPCLTRQQLGHRDIPKRHSIRPLEPWLDFQRSQEKILHFHWVNFLFSEVIAYWERLIWISAKCSWPLPHLKKKQHSHTLLCREA